MEYRLHRDTGEKKPTRYFSKKQEDAVAKSVGGRTTPNSGATPVYKGDITTDNFIIECKTSTTDKKSFTLHKEWFDKNRDESIFMKKEHSAVVVSFGPNSENYYIINENDFLIMKQLLELYESGQINIDL